MPLDSAKKPLEWSLKIPIRAFSIGIFLSAVITGLLWYFYRLETKDLTAIFNQGLLITTLIYTAETLKMNFNNNKVKNESDANKQHEGLSLLTIEQGKFTAAERRLELERKKISLDLIGEWNQPHIVGHANHVREYLLKHTKVTIGEEFEKDFEHRKSVIVVLNYFEKIATACVLKIADEEVLKNYFGTLFSSFSFTLEEYIRFKQADNSDFFCNFTYIVTYWKQKKS